MRTGDDGFKDHGSSQSMQPVSEAPVGYPSAVEAEGNQGETQD
jgi:hypothetical protein